MHVGDLLRLLEAGGPVAAYRMQGLAFRQGHAVDSLTPRAAAGRPETETEHTGRGRGAAMQAKLELVTEQDAPDPAETRQLERQTLREIIDAHERGISRLPVASELRASLERALPYLRLAVGPPPGLELPEQRLQQPSLFLRPL